MAEGREVSASDAIFEKYIHVVGSFERLQKTAISDMYGRIFPGISLFSKKTSKE